MQYLKIVVRGLLNCPLIFVFTGYFAKMNMCSKDYGKIMYIAASRFKYCIAANIGGTKTLHNASQQQIMPT